MGHLALWFNLSLTSPPATGVEDDENDEGETGPDADEGIICKASGATTRYGSFSRTPDMNIGQIQPTLHFPCHCVSTRNLFVHVAVLFLSCVVLRNPCFNRCVIGVVIPSFSLLYLLLADVLFVSSSKKKIERFWWFCGYGAWSLWFSWKYDEDDDDE